MQEEGASVSVWALSESSRFARVEDAKQTLRVRQGETNK